MRGTRRGAKNFLEHFSLKESYPFPPRRGRRDGCASTPAGGRPALSTEGKKKRSRSVYCEERKRGKEEKTGLTFFILKRKKEKRGSLFDDVSSVRKEEKRGQMGSLLYPDLQKKKRRKRTISNLRKGEEGRLVRGVYSERFIFTLKGSRRVAKKENRRA